MEIVSSVYSNFSGDGGESESGKRKFLQLGEKTGSQIDSDLSASDRGRNKEPKLSVDEPEAKQPPPSSKGKTKTWCSEMTDDELLHSLDEHLDMEISKEVIQKIRDYSTQVAESDGFEIDTWPGDFFGVTNIVPTVLSKEQSPKTYALYESFAKFAMDDYNKNNQTEFEFEQLKRVNLQPMRYTRCYLTFSARGRDQNATHETFQALVVAHIANEHDKKLQFCRPRPNKLRI